MSFLNRKHGDLFSAIAAYDLWSYQARLDIRIKYRRSKIGPFWITLSMAIFCVALGIVYSQLFKTQIAQLLPFLSIGMVVWSFVSTNLGEMPTLFVDNAAYIKDMRINPITIILRALTKNSIIFAHNLLIVFGIYLYFGIWPGWIGLLMVPGFIILFLNIFFIGISLSILGARFRDISQITQSILQVLFFITPISWLPHLLSKDSWVIAANPVAYYLDLVRSPLLGQAPQLISWEISILTLTLAFIFSAWLYRRKSANIAFWV